MKASGQIQKWGVGVLGAVSLALLANLVLQFTRTPTAGNARPRTIASPKDSTTTGLHAKTRTSATATAAAGKPKLPEELARYDPILKLDLLKELEDRPLPELERNPFEFPKPPARALPNQTSAQGPGAPAPAPAPPPVSLTPMGYSEGVGGIKEAMVSDEDQVFVVHEGDSVGTRYKIIKITPTVITVEDATQHRTVDLPIPQ